MAYRQVQPVQDEVELETMAEAELSRLKRQYRIMENDRISYAEEARLELGNQRSTMVRLEIEKADLALAIGAAKSGSNARKDRTMDERLDCLLVKRTKYIETMRNEKQQINELQEQIVKVTKEVTALKAKIRTDSQSKDAITKQNHLVAILENRLEVATKRFNLVVAENSRLRDKIDALLKERGQFNVLWGKMIGQLNTGKLVINDLIEQATVTFNQRDEELNKIHALRERGARDLKGHTSEMCELQRTLDNELKLQEFLGVKGQYREMADLNAKKESARRAKREETRNKIAVYTNILNLVKEFTGEEEIDKLTSHFVKQEEENFALFGYVNELNDELEGLRSRVAQLRVAIDEARALNANRGDQQAETLERIAKQLEERIALADAAEAGLDESNEVAIKLLAGIDRLFGSMRCDNSPILDLLGDNSTVTMNNVMLYLGIIEKRINEMLNKVHWMEEAAAVRSEIPPVDEEKKLRAKAQVPNLRQIVPSQPCSLCVEKEEMQYASEGLECPLTRDEASEKLDSRLQDDISELIHNVSGCHLPAARKIMQLRYQ